MTLTSLVDFRNLSAGRWKSTIITSMIIGASLKNFWTSSAQWAISLFHLPRINYNLIEFLALVHFHRRLHFPCVTFASSIYSIINNNFNSHFDFQNSPSVSKMPLQTQTSNHPVTLLCQKLILTRLSPIGTESNSVCVKMYTKQGSVMGTRKFRLFRIFNF